MRKLLKITMLCILGILLIKQAMPIEASTLRFNLQQSSTMYYVDQGQLKSLQGQVIPYASTIQIDMQISNQGESIASSLSFIKKEGMAFQPYYEGVLKVNNRIVSASEYQAFISTGLSYIITSQPITISLQVQSIGSYNGRIMGALSVYSKDVTEGKNPYYCEHVGYGSFAFLNQHQVRFYNQGKVVYETQVVDQQSVKIPEVSVPQGYTFLGFNQQADGNGSFYKGQSITQDEDFFAIFQPIEQVQVQYYVDTILYMTKWISLGSSIEEIEAPKKEGKIFMGWEGDKENITKNTKLIANYQDIIVSDKNIEVTIHEYQKGSDTLKRVTQDIQDEKGSNKNQEMQKQISFVDTMTPSKGIAYGLLGLVVLQVVRITIQMYKRKKDKNENLLS